MSFLKLPESKSPQAENRSVVGGNLIELSGVYAQYDDQTTPVLKDLNFKLGEKEKIAIVGAVGAGKSTF